MLECQRIDESETVVHKRDVMLGENHRLVHNKESKNQKKVQRDHKKFLHLVNGFLLQGSTGSLHVFSPCHHQKL